MLPGFPFWPRGRPKYTPARPSWSRWRAIFKSECPNAPPGGPVLFLARTPRPGTVTFLTCSAASPRQSGFFSLSTTIPAALSPENDDVLLRQDLDRTVELETFRLHLRPHLLHRHLVLRPDRDVGVFGTIFEQHQTAVGLQRVADTVEHLLELGELMVDIHQQDQIRGGRRQLRGVPRPQNRPHVREMPVPHILSQPVEHGLLDVLAVDDALGSDTLGQTPRAVADPGADIGDHRSLGDLQGV